MAQLKMSDNADRMEKLIGKIVRDEATQRDRTEYGNLVISALNLPDPTRETRDRDLARIDEMLEKRRREN